MAQGVRSFQGHALARMGRRAEAREAFASARVSFELFARVHPQATLTMSDATRTKLRRYVLLERR